MPNLAALRAAIFLLFSKNRWGAHMCPPPGRARVKEANVPEFYKTVIECYQTSFRTDVNNDKPEQSPSGKT